MMPTILYQEITDLITVGYQIKTKEIGQKIYIIFENFVLPKGYNLESTDLLVWTCSAYPSCAFDMFWVDETLTLENGVIPKASSIENHLEKKWRRFSIHPYSKKPWKPSEDSLNGFLSYINKRLNELI